MFTRNGEGLGSVLRADPDSDEAPKKRTAAKKAAPTKAKPPGEAETKPADDDVVESQPEPPKQESKPEPAKAADKPKTEFKSALDKG